MTVQGGAETWHRQAHCSLVILKKNIRLYYLKPPVLIFGVLFPVFFFLAFKMGDLLRLRMSSREWLPWHCGSRPAQSGHW